MIEYYKNLSLENLFYTDKNGILQEEEWRDVPNYVGHYQGSSLGRLKTLERFFINHLNLKVTIKEKILIQNTSKRYLSVCLCKDGKQRTRDVHQVIFFTFYGYYPKRGSGFKIDHDDNISFNNVLTNLNVITHRKNLTKDIDLKGRCLGVHKDRKKYRAIICLNRKKLSLGHFEKEEDAGKAYLEAFNLLEKGNVLSI